MIRTDVKLKKNPQKCPACGVDVDFHTTSSIVKYSSAKENTKYAVVCDCGHILEFQEVTE